MIENSCKREGCQVAQSGKCLEGFEPSSDCPYLIGADATSGGTSEGESFVALPLGEALTEVEASEVTRQGVTKLVVVAGPHDSGKTTILTSLFDGFLEAPVGNYLFAGSQTLVGFERRCHDSREDSGRKEPHTVHTQVTDVVELLHLRLAPASKPSQRVNLLLSDISGERFRKLRDSADAVKKMTMLQRADHLSIVIDGESLINSAKRHDARTDARMLLRSLTEARILAPTCRLQVVFSKWDAITGHPEQSAIVSFVNDTKAALQQIAGEMKIEFVEIAARPKNEKLPFAFGLPTLMRIWLEDLDSGRPNLYLPTASTNLREYSRFAQGACAQQNLSKAFNVHWI